MRFDAFDDITEGEVRDMAQAINRGKRMSHHVSEAEVRMNYLRRITGFIYFFTDGTATKIGFSMKDPKLRLKALQTGNPRKINYLGYVLGHWGTEKRLHQLFSGKQLVGEWFDITQEDLFAQGIYLVKNGALPTLESCP